MEQKNGNNNINNAGHLDIVKGRRKYQNKELDNGNNDNNYNLKNKILSDKEIRSD